MWRHTSSLSLVKVTCSDGQVHVRNKAEWAGVVFYGGVVCAWMTQERSYDLRGLD